MAKSSGAARKNGKHAQSDLREMAARYIQARNILVRAGRTLHDNIGSPLSAAGVQLQLLRMDVPGAAAHVDAAIQTLDSALDHVRELSRDLCLSPVDRGGLKQALLRLSQDLPPQCEFRLDYSTRAIPPSEIAAAIYDAARTAADQALRHGATEVSITVRGSRPLMLRVADNGRKSGRARALSLACLLAREQGLTFEYSTGKSTIVSISYAVRRTAGG